MTLLFCYPCQIAVILPSSIANLLHNTEQSIVILFCKLNVVSVYSPRSLP